MDHAGNIGFTDGTYLALDGFDKIFFYNEIPNYELEYTMYSLQREQLNYIGALNALAQFKFIGIKRHDSADELEFAGKKYVYEHYYNNINQVDKSNEILYVKTSAISTIAVYEQWKK